MIEILHAKDGNKTLKKNGIYLLSPYHPGLDVEKFLDKRFSSSDKQFYILFGGALGYLPEALLKRSIKPEDIFLFEPEKEFEPDFQYRFSGINIISYSAAYYQEFEKRLLSKKKPVILAMESFKKAYPDLYDWFSNFISLELKTAVENLKVSAYFSKVWFINFIRNMSNAIYGERFYSYVKNGLSIDMTVIVTAAGPSLNKYLEDLKKNRDNLIILSVLSSAATLLKSGIRPDFVIVSDAGVSNRLYSYNLPQDIPVFASVYASSSLISVIKNPIIFYDLEQEIENPSFQLKYPSVTIDAGLIAKRFFKEISVNRNNKSNIVFCGFDLSHSINYGSHSRYNALMDLRETKYSRLNTITGGLSSFMAGKDLVPSVVPGYYTESRFLMVKKLAETCFKGCYYLSGGNRFNGLKEISSLSDILQGGAHIDKEKELDKIRNNFQAIKSGNSSIPGVINKIKINLKDNISLNKNDVSNEYSGNINQNIFIREILSEIPVDKIGRYYLNKINKITAHKDYSSFNHSSQASGR